jgi:isoleucyl-tRNA synthetase
VRRSRRRFWKSEDDQDKNNAYVTLHYVLCNIAQLLAPWSPFVSDKLWRGLTAGTDEAVSVHLSDWPVAGKVDSDLIDQMAAVRNIVTEALSARAESKIKVRQPLQKLEVPVDFRLEFNEIIAEEVNVKEVVSGKNLKLDTEITPELKAEGMMRDVVRHVQNARKAAGLEVDDRIVLTLDAGAGALADAIATHAEAIQTETLATELKTSGASGGVPAKVDGQELFIGVMKA